MSPQRFIQLAETYGGDIGRWPVDSRAAARELVAVGSPLLRTALAQAIDLDSTLRAQRIEPASLALQHRMEATLPGISNRLATRAPWWKRGGFWPGIGIAGVGVAGVAAGVFTVSTALSLAAPAAVPDFGWNDSAGVFSGLSAGWGDE